MKIVITKASVTAVTNLMENHGKDNKVPAKSLTVKAQIPADLLDEFNPHLKPALFQNDIPAFPEISKIEWATEYENADATIHGLKFGSVEVAKVWFAPLPGFICDLGLTLKVPDSEDEKFGKLDKVLRHEVKITLTKMVQKTIEPDPEGPEAAPPPQPTLPEITPLHH